MSVRYFGEYLVSRKVITPQQLLDALIAQLIALPPLADLISQENLLATEQILDVLHLQQQEGLDFRSAARRLNLWNKNLEARLETRVQELRPALGQLLIQRELLDLKALTRHLDDYLAQASAPLGEAEAAPPEVVPASPGVQLVSAPIAIDKVIELRDLFEERKRRAVKVALSFIKDRDLPDPATVAKLIGDVRKMLAPLAELGGGDGIGVLGRLLQELNALVIRCERPAAADPAFLRVFAALAYEAIEECWHLREDLITTCDETKLSGDPPRLARLADLLQRLQELS